MLLIATMFLGQNAFAAIAYTTPNDFELTCDTVDVIGYSLGKDRIPLSYIKWDKTQESLTIKSEELDEFNDTLNPSENYIYSSQEDFGTSQRILITFKAKSYAEDIEWKYESGTRFVSVQVDSSSTSKGAVLKLTEFWQTNGVISSVETKQAICKKR